MYIEIFNDYLVDSEKVLGVFDLDNTTTNKFTNEFLNEKRKSDKVVYLGNDIPKSFLIMDSGQVIITELSRAVLKKRFEG